MSLIVLLEKINTYCCIIRIHSKFVTGIVGNWTKSKTIRQFILTSSVAQNGGGTKNENLGPCTKLNQKCLVKSSGWPHQNVSIYFFEVYNKLRIGERR